MSKINRHYKIDGNSGFSLLELAVVIFIISLLLFSFIQPLSLQREIQQVQTTKQTLVQIKQALMVYAVTQNRLPCPDTDILNASNEGLENRAADQNCIQQYGFLPWAELGVDRFDPWQQRYLYRLDSAFNRSIPTDGLPSDNMRVRDPFDNSDVTRPNAAGGSHLIAVIYSCGVNRVNNQVLNTPQANCRAVNSSTFSQGSLIEGSSAHSFDDYLIWLPKNILLYHLLNAKRWRGI